MLDGLCGDLLHHHLPWMTAPPLHPQLMSGRVAPRWPYPPYANPFSTPDHSQDSTGRNPEPNSTISKGPITHDTSIIPDEHTNSNPTTASFQPTLVGVNSSVIEEYDPARPNDYEDYCQERKWKQAEAEIKRELEEREKKIEEREMRYRECDRDGELNISGDEAWRRRDGVGGIFGEDGQFTRLKTSWMEANLGR
ncbi:mRNA splicing factor [Abeliophyllum distichum]|uniref:mRNA splicing factor n=1 Tax=Abeliophyllum distichum TaxID=126358 RepID=A0ABD1VWD1_9LAMI